MEVNSYKDVHQIWEAWEKEEKSRTAKVQGVLKNVGISIGFLMIIIGILGLILTFLGALRTESWLLIAGGLITIIECIVIVGISLHYYLNN